MLKMVYVLGRSTCRDQKANRFWCELDNKMISLGGGVYAKRVRRNMKFGAKFRVQYALCS